MRTLLALSMIMIVTTATFAQVNTRGWSGGVSFGETFGQTDLQDRKAEFLGRMFFRYGLIDRVQPEVGLGIGQVSGAEYRSFIIPMDVRLVLSPLALERWNPFVYGGIGLLYYQQDDLPAAANHDNEDGRTGFVPVGVGLQYLANPQTLVELTGGFNQTFTDALKAVPSEKKDAYWTATIGLTITGESGSADPDGDGLTNDEERELGTDPHNADTDGDGLSDGDEVHKYHTNPLNADSDGDGLKDGDEVNVYKTDPNKVDTDGDGLSDFDEVTKYKTDPLKADTDGDSLSDGDEVLKYHTDPLNKDTDGDGLTDGEEVLKYKTDPLKKDTDGGSVSDGDEIAHGTNPLDPTDDIPKPQIKVEVGQSIVLQGIVFESGKSDILPEAADSLAKAYNTLAQNPDITVEIRGYTDNSGSRSLNMKLSQARADAVKDFLVKKGIDEKRITSKGYGPGNPVASNKTKEGRQQNRRIEFYRIK